MGQQDRDMSLPLSERPNPIDPDMWTVICGSARYYPTRVVEYQHDSHFAVYEYDGINGSKNITHTLSDEEQDHLRGGMIDIMTADPDEFKPYT